LLITFAVLVSASTVGPYVSGFVASDATPFAFVDIAGTGTAVLAGADDDKVIVTLPFSFSFYGQNRTSVCISSNGTISFGATCNADFANQDLTGGGPS